MTWVIGGMTVSRAVFSDLFDDLAPGAVHLEKLGVEEAGARTSLKFRVLRQRSSGERAAVRAAHDLSLDHRTFDDQRRGADVVGPGHLGGADALHPHRRAHTDRQPGHDEPGEGAAHEGPGGRQQTEQTDQVADEAGQDHEQPAGRDQAGVAELAPR
jgi:hypothetical protein